VSGGKRTTVRLFLQTGPLAHARLSAPPTIGDRRASLQQSMLGRSILGWTLVGAGAAAGVTGAALLVGADGCVPMDGFECSRLRTSRVPALALMGAGIASSVVGVLVLVSRPGNGVAIGLGPAAIMFRIRL
jgi:hypothetical protein